LNITKEALTRNSKIGVFSAFDKIEEHGLATGFADDGRHPYNS
jgi:hypothetical protein